MDFRGTKLAGNDGSPKNKGVFVIYAASQFYRKLGLKHVRVSSRFLWARSSGIAWVGSRLRVKVLQSKCCPGRRSQQGLHWERLCFHAHSGCWTKPHPCHDGTGRFPFPAFSQRLPSIQGAAPAPGVVQNSLPPKSGGSLTWPLASSKPTKKRERCCKTGVSSHKGVTTWRLDCGVQHGERLLASQVGRPTRLWCHQQRPGGSRESAELRGKMLRTVGATCVTVFSFVDFSLPFHLASCPSHSFFNIKPFTGLQERE